MDTNRILMVDNLPDNYVNHLPNAIPILSYDKKSSRDVELVKLANYLKLITREDNLKAWNERYFNLKVMTEAQSAYQSFDYVLHRREELPGVNGKRQRRRTVRFDSAGMDAVVQVQTLI